MTKKSTTDQIVERTAVREKAAKIAQEMAHRDRIRLAEDKAAKGDWRIMCLLHLWDLKRFGYSPTRTELNIPSDRPGTMIRPTDPYRIYSSSPASW